MPISKAHILNLWLPVFLYAGLIFYLSSIPQIPLPPIIPFIDKILHLIEYAILGWLLTRALKKSEIKFSVSKLYILVLFLALFYGITDEFHQSFIEGRVSSIWDVLVDGLGGIIGARAYRL